jgi:hypothetical protein
MMAGPGQRIRHPLAGRMPISGGRARLPRWGAATTSGARGQQTPAQWGAATTSGARGRGRPMRWGAATINGARGQGRLTRWAAKKTNGAREQVRAGAARTSGAAHQGHRQGRMDIMRARQKDNGARVVGARQTLDGTAMNLPDNGDRRPHRRRLHNRRVRPGRAPVAPIARSIRQAWEVNRCRPRMLAANGANAASAVQGQAVRRKVAAGASAKRPPGRPNPAATSLRGRRRAGNRPSHRGHAAARAANRRHSRSGSSRAEALLSLPGRARLISGGRPPHQRDRVPADR